MKIFMALLKCHGRSHKVSSQLVAKQLKKTKFYQNLCLAKQSNEEATLGPNCGKLARSFELKIFHNIAMNSYNNDWVGRRNKNTILIKFDRCQNGYSAD